MKNKKQNKSVLPGTGRGSGIHAILTQPPLQGKLKVSPELQINPGKTIKRPPELI
jgi:hypothetical protein